VIKQAQGKFSLNIKIT